MGILNYRDLIAWQKAMDLVEEVYRATREFPSDELYGLTSQLRRAVVSVPSNIAEGRSRRSTHEFLHHLWIARGSLSEAETQLMIARRLAYISEQRTLDLLGLSEEVGRLINGLANSLNRPTSVPLTPAP